MDEYKIEFGVGDKKKDVSWETQEEFEAYFKEVCERAYKRYEQNKIDKKSNQEETGVFGRGSREAFWRQTPLKDPFIMSIRYSPHQD